MPVRYTPAGDVGADRIVNAVAAYEQYGARASVPLIVVDFGTGDDLRRHLGRRANTSAA